MPHYISRTSLLTAWCLALAAILWTTAGIMPTVATIAIGAIGVALAVVPFVLARRPQQTMAEAIREAQTGRSQ